ncbi:MAG: translation initiation factor IF-2 [Thermoguttaceae bacterium]|nr:translation initiation factor IF-2 [Thermoguttaceae bacterium]
MPIRIHNLAKELHVDVKTIFDACQKAGIQVKGSSGLASLSDEEVSKVKAILAESSKPASGKAAAAILGTKPPPLTPPVVRREDYIAPSGTIPGKVPVLPTKPARPASPTKPPEPAPPAPAAEIRAPEKVEAPKPAPKPSEKPEKPEKPIPVIKLAPMPAPPPVPPKPEEPPPQKPDLRLPPDVIRASKMGAPVPSLDKEPQKEPKEKKAKEAAQKPAVPVTGPAKGPTWPEEKLPPPPPQRKPERPKRAGKAAPVEEEEEFEIGVGGKPERLGKRKPALKARKPKPEEEEEEEAFPAPQRAKRLIHTGRDTSQPRKQKIVLQAPCTVREFSEAVGIPARMIQKKLLEMGQLATLNTLLEQDSCELLVLEFGLNVDIRPPERLEEKVLRELEQTPDDPTQLRPRPPVVTFLGHVDHGKTSLLDRILGLQIAASEKGGITQHIRAYQIQKDGRAITFVDTPGHEAFTAMRARGANVTDIAVLVVAVDDGVMPQTEEAISHARAAGVPIIVALNKIDLPVSQAKIERIYQDLAANGLLPTEWGGETELVKTSALTGAGIDQLLETILTLAELHDYKANPNRPALGTCLEAELQEHRGVVSKLLVQNGTLRVEDIVVCGIAHGRVRALYDTLDPYKKYEAVGPGTPVHMIGLDVPPVAGDRFYVVQDISLARQLAAQRQEALRQQELAGLRPRVTLENWKNLVKKEGKTQTLNLIIRADTRGSIEALRKEISKLENPEVEIKILQAMVGGITEADVYLAEASEGIIIGFNVVPDESARQLAEQHGVQIRRYDIIYQVTEDLKAAIEGMLEPIQREEELGRVLVKQIFHISRVGTVAGCQVLSGIVARDARVRVIRDSRVIGDYPIESLRREKDDVREVRSGLECGIKLKGFEDIKEGDVLEVYRIQEVARTLA